MTAPQPPPASAPPPLDRYTGDEAELIGRALDGRYVIEGILGKGAMGLVLGARHALLDKRVAIKLLHPALVTLDEMRERFLREARAGSALEHHAVVRVSDFGVTPEGLHYLVMEYLEGEDLYAWMEARGEIPAATAAGIGAQLADALAAIHDAGFVHRDLKPENIWVLASEDPAAPPRIKILDLGIAALLSTSAGEGEMARLTKTGCVVGTVHYMSPEQTLGEAVDGRSDLYALGCILWELVTGACPFDGASQMAVMMKHLSEAPEAPSARAEGVPGWFDAVVLRCLAKRPEVRFQRAEDVAAALRAGALQRGGGVSPREAQGALGPPAAESPGHPRQEPRARPTSRVRPPPTLPVETGVSTATSLAAIREASRRRWGVAAALGLGVLVGALVLLWPDGGVEPAERIGHGVEEDAAGVAEDRAEGARVALGDREERADEGSLEVAAAAADGLAAEAPAPGSEEEARGDEPGEAPAEPGEVTLLLGLRPYGATVTGEDGEALGVTPLAITAAADGGVARFKVTHPGRVPLLVEGVRDRDRTFDQVLARVPGAARSTPRDGRAPSAGVEAEPAAAERAPGAAAPTGAGAPQPASRTDELMRPARPVSP